MANGWEMVPAWESAIQVKENADRWDAYRKARLAADLAGKPLLNIGCPRVYGPMSMKYPCGDVCLDIDPQRLESCESSSPTLGDVRRIPFPDGYFGAALCCHVLEHLPTVADAEQALAELRRVADTVFVCSPTRSSLMAWLHPEHRLWVNHLPDGSITFEQRSRGDWTELEMLRGITTVGIAGSIGFTLFLLARHFRARQPAAAIRRAGH